MAYIDRIYVNSYQQVFDFVNWAKGKKFIYNGYTFNPLNWLYYTLEDYIEHFGSQINRIPLLSTSTSQDYVLIKHCPLKFIQDQLQHVYNIEYYYSIKSGTSNFDTFNRNDISGQKIKCIKETKFCNKRFHYKSHKVGKHNPLRYWVEVYHPDYFLNYEENTDKWLISGYELYDPYYISSVCHKKIKTRKALIRNIRKWNLPKGSIVRWVGEYIGDDMEFKIY